MQNQHPPASAPNLVAGRNCDGCTLCCKLFEIKSLPKPAGVWCRHCDVGTGCTIYETRPAECRDFFCHYRIDTDVPEYWKPSHSHMAMTSDADGVRITVHVDPDFPDAWRGAPYYRDLKAWSANRLKADKQLHVRIGPKTIVVLPDRDVDLGDVGARLIVTSKTWGPGGPRFEFQVIEQNDPRAQALLDQAAKPNPFRW